MELYSEPGFIQYAIGVAAIVMIMAFVGLKTGRGGQLVISLFIVSLWTVLSLYTDTLTRLVNLTYRTAMLLGSCGMSDDSTACRGLSDVMRLALVNPDDPRQTRFFLLATFGSALLVALALVIRFGKRPNSVAHKMLGAALGVANGLILSYLLLPLLSEADRGLLPLVATLRAEHVPLAPDVGPGHGATIQTGSPLILVIFIVVFVIVAVRSIQHPKVES